MTTLTQYDGIDELLDRLQAVRSRYWASGVLSSALALLAVLAGGVVLAGAVLGYWPGQPPLALRWGLLGTVLLTSLAAAAALLRRLIWRCNSAQMARFVERHLAEARNDLINSILLGREQQPASPELVQRAIAEAVVRCRSIDLRRSVSARPMRRWGLIAAGALLLLAGFAALQPGAFGRGLKALSPRTYVPTVNELELLALEPGDAELLAGEPLTIRAEVRNDDARLLDARVVIQGRTEPLLMLPDRGYSVFTAAIPAVEDSFAYRVEIGNSRWPAEKPWYTVRAVKRIAIEGLTLGYEYPAYTGLEPNTVPDAEGPIEAPNGSRVLLTLRLGERVPRAVLEHRRGGTREQTTRQPMAATPDGREFSTQLPVDANGAYRLLLQDAQGRTFQQLPFSAGPAGGPSDARLSGYYPIRAIRDRLPKVRFIRPARDVQVAPGGTLETVIAAEDDYAVSEVAFYLGREGRDLLPVRKFPGDGNQDFQARHIVRLGEQYADGDVLIYYASATDNRNLPGVGGPQSKTTSRYKILVQDPAKVAAEKAKRYAELRKRLLEILAIQEEQIVNAAIARKGHATLAERRAAGEDVASKAEMIRRRGSEVLAGQKAIRAKLVYLAEEFPFDPEMVELHQVIAVLAGNEAATAVEQAGVLAELLTRWEPDEQPHAALAATQRSILDTLQQLLALMPSYAGQKSEPRTETAGDDLPPDHRQRLEKLAEGLKEFVDDQKKIIEASKRLAKQPVDNFTKAEEELLKDLTARQDKWEKFLNEQFTDFSKLMQQDFANPAILKELISVKSDVTMAKDALKNKATEIATAAEDNGAENAESLTANIEKWLPDKPDREKWNMEDPPGDEQLKLEQPELPTELEDLVGDLLEEEEDLFEEMQDLASKAAGSFDKGIGWDALDGPISNMNAQGVTGNQLPNQNELQGRSGEGRQGKSAGEFVEDKAIGKGGRRTPTRLTPEPFQTGQVDDESKEPAGGATGGGKFSGAGEEGLEGPVPPELKKEMPRLAGKQAQLRNRAERLREKFKQSNYANFKLLQAITLMNRVENHLQDYRYRNALRQRDVTLDALAETRLYLGKGIDVVQDASSQMPKYIRDDIDSARGGNLPPKYREVVKQYYQRLSEASKKP